RFAEPEHAVAGRIIRLAGRQRLQRPVAQLVRDGELPRGEIAHREVRDLLPAADGGPDLGGDAQDLGADQPPRHGGKAAPRVWSVQIELQLLHGPSASGGTRPSTIQLSLESARVRTKALVWIVRSGAGGPEVLLLERPDRRGGGEHPVTGKADARESAAACA